MKKKNDLLDDAVNFILVIFIIYIVCLFYDWFFNRDEFWHLAMLGIGVVIITTILCILIVWAIRKHKDKKWNNLLRRIRKS